MVKDKQLLYDCFDLRSYLKWLREDGKEYRIIKLEDGSEWTLRELNQKQYVHLHPSRYSKNTLRVKANILKTVICLLLFSSQFDMNFINHIRVNRLQLSPVDVTKKHTELTALYNLFLSNTNI